MIAPRLPSVERGHSTGPQAAAPAPFSGADAVQGFEQAFEQVSATVLPAAPVQAALVPSPASPESFAALLPEDESADQERELDEDEAKAFAAPAESLLGVLGSLSASPPALPYGGRHERHAQGHAQDHGSGKAPVMPPSSFASPLELEAALQALTHHDSGRAPQRAAEVSPAIVLPSSSFVAPDESQGALQTLTRHVGLEGGDFRETNPLSAKTPLAPIASLSMETHLPPAGSQPAFVQVAQRIDSALAPAQAQAPHAVSTAAAPHILPGAMRSPVQILRLQLQPVELGAVDVELRLRGGAIEVRIVAETADARLQLESGADRLGLALREKGYDVQSLVILSDPAVSRLSDQSARSGPESAKGQAEEQPRGGFDQRERNDRRDHARGRNDRSRDDRDGIAG